jgi:hypothetical protein
MESLILMMFLHENVNEWEKKTEVCSRNALTGTCGLKIGSAVSVPLIVTFGMSSSISEGGVSATPPSPADGFAPPTLDRSFPTNV